MIVLDTTVLVYAVGEEHPLRGPCRWLLDGVLAGQISATTTPEVIQEFVDVHGRRRPRSRAARLGRAYAIGLAPLLTTEPDDLERGLRLYVDHPKLSAFDSVLAATAIRFDPDAFVSADRAFGAVRSLRYVDPSVADLPRLIR